MPLISASGIPVPAGIHVRYLNRGEDELWRRCRLKPQSDEAADDFTSGESFRPEAFLIAERSGQAVGRMESILAEPHEAILVDPIVSPGEPVAEVAAALLAKGADVSRGLGVERTYLILQDRLPYFAELSALVPQWGFQPRFEKRLYVLNREDRPFPGPECPPDVEFRSFDGPEDPQGLHTLDRILRRPLNRYDEGERADALLARLADLCRQRRVFYPEDWLVAFLGGEPAGVVLPALMDQQGENATMLYVGVVPEFRGRGLGLLLQHHGLRTLEKRGPQRFLGSCDDRNQPMRRIFERLGYRLATLQRYFELRA